MNFIGLFIVLFRALGRRTGLTGNRLLSLCWPTFLYHGLHASRRTMSSRISRADRSLASFVQALEGLNVVVELQNDAVVRGLLESADEGMNLIINGATYEPLQGAAQSMDFLFIKGARVRCTL